jgi:transcriptional regulator with XRE-family HTH domain
MRNRTPHGGKNSVGQTTPDVKVNLRRFRKSLAISEEDFGRAFGNYTRRQINSYERGESEIPIGLLLAIQEKGYLLTVIFGTEARSGRVARLLGHLPRVLKVHRDLRKLTQSILRTLDDEDRVLEKMLLRAGHNDPDDIQK